MSSVIQVIKVIESLPRIEKPFRFGVTFFSEKDLWRFQAIVDAHTCEQCSRFEEHGEWHGNHLRLSFPFLEIVDENMIQANIHPNCRCYLVRVQEEEVE